MKRIGKKKLAIMVLVSVLLITIAVCFINVIWGIILFAFYALCLCVLAACLLLNKCVKKTNWYKNLFLHTEQFVSNAGYRDNLIRNYEIVNLGSNPALFAFFYENITAQNWSTGSQGLDMDFEILKYFHSYLKTGGTVLVPIMPFTSISPYLKNKPEYWNKSYYAKFARLLDSSLISGVPELKSSKYFSRFPLFYKPASLLYLLHDTAPDTRYLISEQPMMPIELEQDACKWIDGWLKEFDMKSLDIPLTEKWKKYYDESVTLLRSMISYCLERNYKPVLICPPMTEYLSKKFPRQYRQAYVLDFIRKSNTADIPFLDYTDCAEFQDPAFYFNSFFLNLHGRKLFTRRVLKDLGLVGTTDAG